MVPRGLRVRADLKLDDWGWCELSTPLPRACTSGLGQTADPIEPATAPYFSVADIEAAKKHLERRARRSARSPRDRGHGQARRVQRPGRQPVRSCPEPEVDRSTGLSPGVSGLTRAWAAPALASRNVGRPPSRGQPFNSADGACPDRGGRDDHPPRPGADARARRFEVCAQARDGVEAVDLGRPSGRTWPCST